MLEIQDKILDLAAAFDIVFWPVALDFKVKDVEAMADGEIDLCLFNGAVRNSDNEDMAKLLRAKSKILVAFGSCAYEGCIPALSNTTTRAATLDWIYRDSPSTPNPEGVRPQTVTQVHLGGSAIPPQSPQGDDGITAEVRLPDFYDTVYTLDQTVDVDYYVPGCPPQAHQIWAVLETVVDCLQGGKPLPPKGAVLGAGDKTCCDECPRLRQERKLKRFVRPHQIIPDPELCLLDQGIVCMGAGDPQRLWRPVRRRRRPLPRLLWPAAQRARPGHQDDLGPGLGHRLPGPGRDRDHPRRRRRPDRHLLPLLDVQGDARSSPSAR